MSPKFYTPEEWIKKWIKSQSHNIIGSWTLQKTWEAGIDLIFH